ncbi:hypothetical protein ACGFYA_10255 [Streptomyces sp. NPDC048305]|uniref:hypothetical protein n=1 Tax=Streptomyces sp. NPDC048305 TaxID=3365532 RepID=UPI003712296F
MSRSRWSFLVLVAPAILSLTACGRLFPPPPPEGEPVELSLSQAAVTWTDKWGGTLDLKPDGTYTADRACSYDARESGSGTWSRERADERGGPWITVEHENVFTDYEVLRNGGTLKLWLWIGDPDDGDLCVLTAPAR